MKIHWKVHTSSNVFSLKKESLYFERIFFQNALNLVLLAIDEYIRSRTCKFSK